MLSEDELRVLKAVKLPERELWVNHYINKGAPKDYYVLRALESKGLVRFSRVEFRDFPRRCDVYKFTVLQGGLDAVACRQQ